MVIARESQRTTVPTKKNEIENALLLVLNLHVTIFGTLISGHCKKARS